MKYNSRLKDFLIKLIMRIEFCIKETNLYNIAKHILGDIPYITVSNNSITDAQYGTIISEGNSFAEINEGLDEVGINTHLFEFTPYRYIVQQDLKSCINRYFAGELPVGQSILIYTKHPKYKTLIYTPTMRITEDVSNTLNAYLAFRSALLLMKENNIPSASVPIFCLGEGGMNIYKACYQMKEAFKSLISGNLIGKDWSYYLQNDRFLHSVGST